MNDYLKLEKEIYDVVSTNFEAITIFVIYDWVGVSQKPSSRCTIHEP